MASIVSSSGIQRNCTGAKITGSTKPNDASCTRSLQVGQGFLGSLALNEEVTPQFVAVSAANSVCVQSEA